MSSGQGWVHKKREWHMGGEAGVRDGPLPLHQPAALYQPAACTLPHCTLYPVPCTLPHLTLYPSGATRATARWPSMALPPAQGGRDLEGQRAVVAVAPGHGTTLRGLALQEWLGLRDMVPHCGASPCGRQGSGRGLGHIPIQCRPHPGRARVRLEGARGRTRESRDALSKCS